MRRLPLHRIVTDDGDFYGNEATALLVAIAQGRIPRQLPRHPLQVAAAEETARKRAARKAA